MATVGLIISKSPLAIEIAGGLVCAWILTTVVYRWRFHPLAKYPGPWFAKISDFYLAYQSFKGQSHLVANDAHQRWGPVVRLGPNKLSFNSVTALHQIYYSRHIQKAQGYTVSTTTRGGLPNTFNCVDKAYHRRKRKVVNQAFSEQALREVEPMVLKNVDVFVRELLNDPKTNTGDWSDPTNLSPLANYFTLDIIGAFGFGQSFQMLSKPDNRYIREVMARVGVLVSVYYQYPELASLRIDRLLGMIPGGASGSFQRFAGLVKSMVVDRMSKGKDAIHDLFSYLVDAKDPETGSGISLNEIWAESRLFLVAGSDTTAVALSAAFFYLSRNVKCYEKLVSEIRTVFASGAEIRAGTQLSRCLYLRACIDEAMRMSPPVPPPLWREVTTPDGLVIDGEWVRPGTIVGTSMYVMHHNADVFPDSYTYVPDRWLPENTSAAVLEEMKRAYNPFSLGTRRCVARPMAYMELTLVLAKTLWHLDMKAPRGPLKDIGGGTRDALHGRHRDDEFQMYEHFISHHDGPYLQFRCRDGAEMEFARLN